MMLPISNQATSSLLIMVEEIEKLDKLFDPWEGVSIQTDEDYRKLGQIFDEDE